MSKRNQIILILAGMAVLLLGLGILLAVVLTQSEEQAQPTQVSEPEPISSHAGHSSASLQQTGTQSQQTTSQEEERVSSTSSQETETWGERIRRLAENPPDFSQEELESMLEEQTDRWAAGESWEYLPPMQNYQKESPPPSADQLQPGATTQVEPLVYEKPLLSLTPLPEDPFSCDLVPLDSLSLAYMEVEYYPVQRVSVEEALEAEYLYLMWDYDGTTRAYIQIGYPVEYYRVVDYQPATVVGVTQGIYVPGYFAVREGRPQFFDLQNQVEGG